MAVSYNPLWDAKPLSPHHHCPSAAPGKHYPRTMELFPVDPEWCLRILLHAVLPAATIILLEMALELKLICYPSSENTGT